MPLPVRLGGRRLVPGRPSLDPPSSARATTISANLLNASVADGAHADLIAVVGSWVQVASESERAERAPGCCDERQQRADHSQDARDRAQYRHVTILASPSTHYPQPIR